MKRIDRETIQRVIDTADIVEVVSDFVTLKRSGSSYIGLCPFHNERTPSFSVSKSKGICKCFSCGKGGNTVNFLMELEQLSFQEAIRWLAKKYNIEIKEHEVSEKEREADNLRESLFAMNQFALNHFEHNISDTEEGRNIGYEYFRERGLNDAMIKKFHLGYSLKRDNPLTTQAVEAGYDEKYLLATGLSGKSERDNRLYDKYRERVIYPIFSVSGRVIGFGGRILSKEKASAKYINSPENEIYHKSDTLYGLYQAKQSIVKNNKCYLVEGYMDVISMHQSGIENVVASSGTSLTEGQIRLIHRFTSNVTVIYDSDAAGIKASLRGIDLLLAEGLNVRVLLFPEGEDPDSFAQSHSTSELEQYIAENETDFMLFKTNILMKGKEKDPIGRAGAINDIVRSIATIPDPITRSVYIKECSRIMEMAEKTITLQVNRARNEILENRRKQRDARPDAETDKPSVLADNADQIAPSATAVNASASSNDIAMQCRPYEEELVKYVIRLGATMLCTAYDDDGNEFQMTTAEYVDYALSSDGIVFHNPDLERTFRASVNLITSHFRDDANQFITELEKTRNDEIAEGIAKIRHEMGGDFDMAKIEAKEKEVKTTADKNFEKAYNKFELAYVFNNLGFSDDPIVMKITNDLYADKFELSKYHTKYSAVPTEYDQRDIIIERAIYELKSNFIDQQINDVKRVMMSLQKTDSDYDEKVMKTLNEIKRLTTIKSEFAKQLGERIVLPKSSR